MAGTVIDIGQLILEATVRGNNMVYSAEGALDRIRENEKPKLPEKPGELRVSEIELPTIAEAPALLSVEVQSLDSLPEAPIVQAVVASFPSAPALFSKDAPGVFEPVRPSEVAAFTGSAPVFTTPSIPNAPTGDAPKAPTLQTIVLPERLRVQKPSFDPEPIGELPEAPDTARDYKTEAKVYFDSYGKSIDGACEALLDKYNPGARSQFSALMARLTGDFQNGGTGINPAVEQKIIERAKTTTMAEFNRATADSIKAMAVRGFTMPNGVIQAAINQSRSAGMDSMAKAANDLAIAQIELEQKQVNFLISTIVDLQKTFKSLGLSYYQQLMSLSEASIRYSAQLADIALKLYDAQAKAFSIKLEQYKADASVFETLIRASMVEVDIYKAEIEGARAQVQVDEAQVRVYQAQVDAHKTAMDVYAANIRAIVDVANLEKVKLDVFQAEVQAYTASVNANSAQWNAYSAAMQGNEAKVRAFTAESQAHAATVSAYKAQVDAESSRISAVSESNKSELSLYEARVRAYGAQAQANAAVVSSGNEVNKSLLAAYQVENQAAIALAGAASEKYRAESSVKIEQLKMQSQYSVTYAQMYNQFLHNKNTESIEIGRVYAGMAQSALGGVNTLATASTEQ